MANCYRCGDLLNKNNKSQEHIVPNAIGGRLRSYEILCKKCNSLFGREDDAKLCKSLEPFSSFFRVKRDRGKSPGFFANESGTNSKVHIGPGGRFSLASPKREETVVGDGQTMITIKAPTSKIAKQLLSKYEDRLSENGLEKALNSISHEKLYAEHALSFSIEVSHEAKRSVFRNVLGFFMLRGGDRQYIRDAVELFDNPSASLPVYLWNRDVAVFPTDGNDVYHSLSFVGDPSSGLLYCYIEYFSALKYLAVLNDKYDGEKVTSSYCFSVKRHEEIPKCGALMLDRNDIDKFKGQLGIPPNLISDFKVAFGCAIRASYAEQICEAIADKAFSNINDRSGREPTLNEFIDEIIKGLLPNVVAACEKRHMDEIDKPPCHRKKRSTSTSA